MDNPTAIFILVALLALWNLDFISALFNLKALDPKLPEETNMPSLRNIPESQRDTASSHPPIA
jgi:hypothetical protein